MNVSGISVSPQSLQSPATKSKADETLQQLADEGDQVAIAELAAEKPQQNPNSNSNSTTLVGASEPGKGGQVDTYV